MGMANEQTKRLAAKTADAYSYDRYNSWTAVVGMLLRRGFSEQETEAIVRSKWTRWAADNSHSRHGKATATDLARFLDDEMGSTLDDEVAVLVKGTFG